jgi:hypothetical protein
MLVLSVAKGTITIRLDSITCPDDSGFPAAQATPHNGHSFHALTADTYCF